MSGSLPSTTTTTQQQPSTTTASLTTPQAVQQNPQTPVVNNIPAAVPNSNALPDAKSLLSDPKVIEGMKQDDQIKFTFQLARENAEKDALIQRLQASETKLKEIHAQDLKKQREEVEKLRDEIVQTLTSTEEEKDKPEKEKQVATLLDDKFSNEFKNGNIDGIKKEVAFQRMQLAHSNKLRQENDNMKKKI